MDGGASSSVVLAEEDRRRVERLHRLARLLDAGIPIPGTRWSIGLDPIIGLVPGVGDALGAVLSFYIVLQAGRSGVSGPVLLHMVANLAIDALGGAVPVVGDLFDAGWKANMMNVRLLEAYFENPSTVHRASTRRLLGVALAGGAVMLGVLGTATYLGYWLLHLVLR
jgi:Domain of unknown function (DUF4112)